MNNLKSDNILINGLSIVHIIFRLALMASLAVLFYMGGYDEVEFVLLISTVLPLTIFYLVAFLRFATKFPYSISIKKISIQEFNTLLLVTILIYLIMVFIIYINPWYKISVPTSSVQWTLLICEVVHATFAATKLAGLFELREKPTEV